MVNVPVAPSVQHLWLVCLNILPIGQYKHGAVQKRIYFLGYTIKGTIPQDATMIELTVSGKPYYTYLQRGSIKGNNYLYYKTRNYNWALYRGKHTLLNQLIELHLFSLTWLMDDGLDNISRFLSNTLITL